MHLLVGMESKECSGILEIYRAAQAIGDMEDNETVEAASSAAPLGSTSELLPRSVEETHMVILERDAASRASNARYRCKYCSKEFMGGPQKIRVHLSGQRENATRLAKCSSVPEEVKELMLSRMKTKMKQRDMRKHPSEDTMEADESGGEISSSSSTSATNSSPRAPPLSMDLLPLNIPINGLERRNREEEHMIVMSRRHNASPTFLTATTLGPPPSSLSSSPPTTPAPSPMNKRRSYNSQYQCKYCSLVFVGGPQKIRVHVSGIPEGSTRIIRCEYAPAHARESIQTIRNEMAANETRANKKRSERDDSEEDGGDNKFKKLPVIDTNALNSNLEILGLL